MGAYTETCPRWTALFRVPLLCSESYRGKRPTRAKDDSVQARRDWQAHAITQPQCRPEPSSFAGQGQGEMAGRLSESLMRSKDRRPGLRGCEWYGDFGAAKPPQYEVSTHAAGIRLAASRKHLIVQNAYDQVEARSDKEQRRLGRSLGSTSHGTPRLSIAAVRCPEVNLAVERAVLR